MRVHANLANLCHHFLQNPRRMWKRGQRAGCTIAKEYISLAISILGWQGWQGWQNPHSQAILETAKVGLRVVVGWSRVVGDWIFFCVKRNNKYGNTNGPEQPRN
jgi:hypothetical protein